MQLEFAIAQAKTLDYSFFAIFDIKYTGGASCRWNCNVFISLRFSPWPTSLLLSRPPSPLLWGIDELRH
jgi:hypothetical protein